MHSQKQFVSPPSITYLGPRSDGIFISAVQTHKPKACIIKEWLTVSLEDIVLYQVRQILGTTAMSILRIPQCKVKQLQCGSARSAESRTCQARNGVSSAIDRYADRLMFTLWIVSKMKNGGEGCSRFRVHSLLVSNLFVSTFQFLDQRASLRRHKREYRRTIAYSKVYRLNPCVPCSSDLIFKSN